MNTALTAIIVDDELGARESLSKMIEKNCKQLEIVAKADSAQAAFEAITNKQGTQSGTQSTIQKCPHCNLHHPKPDNCWELEKNTSKRPKNWKPVAEHKKKAGDDKKGE